MAICMKFSQLLLPSLNSRGEEFTSDNRNQTVIVIMHRYMVSTQGQVNLYHAGDPTSRSWCRSRGETSNKSTALCCKAACVLSKPVVSEACEVRRAACWDLKHSFPITDSDNISKAELNDIPFQLSCGFRSYSRSNASNNCGEIRRHGFPARASKTGTAIFLWINKPSSRGLPDHMLK